MKQAEKGASTSHTHLTPCCFSKRHNLGGGLIQQLDPHLDRLHLGRQDERHIAADLLHDAPSFEAQA